MSIVNVVGRAGMQVDLAYVYHSWLKGSREAFPEMLTSDYYQAQHDRIEKLLKRCELGVLHPEGAPDVIASWAVRDAYGAVHYVHTRAEYRRKGFARRLVGDSRWCTHMTPDGVHLKRAMGLRYVPQLLDRL